MPTNPAVQSSGTGNVYWDPANPITTQPSNGIQTQIRPIAGLTKSGIWVPYSAGVNPDGTFSFLKQRPKDIAITYDPVTQNATQVVYTMQDGSTVTLTLSYDAYENLIDVAAA